MDERIPSRENVARTFTADESFARASDTYDEWITTATPPDSLDIIRDYESQVFRPACELQMAGLYLLSGITFDKHESLLVGFASFIVDHLLFGWRAALHGQTRISFTLSRAATEGAIFEIAAATNPSEFETAWRGRDGTGGKIVKLFKGISPRLESFLRNQWRSDAENAHVSVMPVISATGTFRDGNSLAAGISFAGQYAGPLSAEYLQQLLRIYSLGAIAGVEAMNVALRPAMVARDRWESAFADLRRTLDTPVPVPPHLAKFARDRAR